MAVIETPRLRLRPITMTDAVDLFQVLRDADVVRYLRYQQATNLAAIQQEITDHFGRDISTVFGIELKSSKKLVGFFEFHPNGNSGILTYALAQADWGKGIVPEAGQALVRYGFETLNFQRLEAHYAAINQKSARVMEKLGMIDRGKIQDFRSQTGEIISVKAYDLTKEQWQAEQLSALG
ncbi:GNAT family N-acetyltransferase [Loigolactobacillus iwatensis]|uniref:GNAT family N-acetyltransferase n=1 Tax=Loigolactobacillus iwatensis TaxID=1267156 RepID=UPI000F7D65D7|nr:GNAT family N-acetyltransferase [Loigolactobacillus iwatensis]